METVLRYRGRTVTTADVEFIKALIADNPGASRRRLSEKLCAEWGWVQTNGAPRSMVCRGLMLALSRAGHIELPPVRWINPNPLARRARPRPVEIDQTPLHASLAGLMPLTFRAVRRTPEESVFGGLMEAHHYLGYTQPVGEHLKYMVYAGERPVACLAWSSAPRHLAPRDLYLGWSAASRKRNIRFIAYNTRYLILPWVHVEHLASHLLGRMLKMLPGEWERVYGHPVYFAETFVDTERFKGTCYRAANWVFLGLTTGRGKNDQTGRANRSRKQVLGYPLTSDFRKRLSN
jgi:hypothetical protein